MKISFNFWHDKAKKIKAISLQTKASLPMSDQSKVIKKAKEKARKEKNKKDTKENEIDKKDKTIALT